jgi:excisionase family DNA binding protein
MFYSLKEAADRLGKTEDQVRQLAKEGKLREFRDGSHLLFKIDEINALLAEGIDISDESLELSPEEPSAEPAAAAEPLELEDLAEPAMSAEPAESLELDDLTEPAESGESAEPLELAEPTESAEPAKPAEPAEADADASSLIEQALEETGQEDLQLEEEGSSASDLAVEGDASSELGLVADQQGEGLTKEEEMLFLEEEAQPAAETPAETDEEISLAAESPAASGSDITDMDTALTGEGAAVLGETDTEYDVTEDSMAETVGSAEAAAAGTEGGTEAGTGTGAEASLEEIEDDVNLDSFGSGSGLLDLSLQADDTSLGGILDEIYTAEGGEEGAAAAATPEAGSVEDITAEAETVVPEEELTGPETVAVAPVAGPAYAAYIEAAPDSQSNILGMLLFLPLLALLYTAIVTVAALRGVMPSILSPIKGLTWPIMGAAVVAAGIVVAISFFAGGERTKAAPKKVKEVKTKEKPKKEKPEKVAKEKPAKEKKSFFGKKKK